MRQHGPTAKKISFRIALFFNFIESAYVLQLTPLNLVYLDIWRSTAMLDTLTQHFNLFWKVF